MVKQQSTKAKNLLSRSVCVGCGKVAGVFVASFILFSFDMGMSQFTVLW